MLGGDCLYRLFEVVNSSSVRVQGLSGVRITSRDIELVYKDLKVGTLFQYPHSKHVILRLWNEELKTRCDTSVSTIDSYLKGGGIRGVCIDGDGVFIPLLGK